MMRQEKIFRWTIEYDREATIEAYNAIDRFVGCTCDYCENFRVVQSQLPKTYFSLLDKLGIDPDKVAESAHFNKTKNGMHLYGWWFHIVGQVIYGGTDFILLSEDEGSKIEMVLRNRRDVVPTTFPQNLIQIDFFSELPWGIEKPEPEE